MVFSRIVFPALLLSLLGGAPPAANAHELWIEPLRFRASVGEAVSAQLKLGEFFKGDDLPYLPVRVLDAAVWDSTGKRPLTSLIGDIPAFNETAGRPGLLVLAYHSTAQRLVYSDYAKFEKFLADKALLWVANEHRARGLAATGFTEAYSRCAKALVRIGSVGGADLAVGMPIELVAEADPYAADRAAHLPVRLLWQGEPLAGARITVFRRQGDVAVTTVATDAAGRAAVPLAGGGAFLLDAVHMSPGSEHPDDAWHSYWASLTFEIAADD